MSPITKTIKADFLDRKEEALAFVLEHSDKTLKDLFFAFPARLDPEDKPRKEDFERPLSEFTIQPIYLTKGEGLDVKLEGQEAPEIRLRDVLDELWEQESVGKLERKPTDEPENYPDEVSDKEAVRKAYYHEIQAIADYLRNGLSVLVQCDKILTELIYEYVCQLAGKQKVMDTDEPAGVKQGEGANLNQALEGGNSSLKYLPIVYHNLRPPHEVLVLRALDLLDTPTFVELLYQPTQAGERAQLLGFVDASIEVQKVLLNRFAVHISITGLPRYVALDGKNPVYTVTHLISKNEYACFDKYDPEGLYKNVSGLNAVQFRQAMRYVGAKAEEGSEANQVYRIIRQFKISSGDEIEIPDTTFENIGGYEHIKQQLRRIIALIAGPIKGLDEKQRTQLIPRGFIFHGPPGTGKTLFAKAIANEMNATIQMISGPEIMDKYVGQSENNLRRIFNTARRNAPAVVFFDEFDSVASQRSNYSDGGSRANNAVVAQLLTELDGFRQDQAILVIGTTNRIDIMDEALLRPSRFRPIEINLPDYAARRHVAIIHARNFGVDQLLKDLFALAQAFLDDYQASKSKEADESQKEWEIPQNFLDQLFAVNPAYRLRYDLEHQRAGFLREVNAFFNFLALEQKAEQGDSAAENEPSRLADKLEKRLQEIGGHYGLALDKESLLDLEGGESDALLTPMRADIRSLFTLIEEEKRRKKDLSPDSFVQSILDLVAEYTLNFNNDEIRAIFQEASLEYHLEGQLVTPRFIGQKIGLIRKRRDEREAQHLGSNTGRN